MGKDALLNNQEAFQRQKLNAFTNSFESSGLRPGAKFAELIELRNSPRLYYIGALGAAFRNAIGGGGRAVVCSST